MVLKLWNQYNETSAIGYIIMIHYLKNKTNTKNTCIQQQQIFNSGCYTVKPCGE
jgi:hypothetical protein